MKINTNPVRGGLDFMPADMENRQIVKNIILNTYKNNGFLQIKTPILESLDLLVRSDSGENSTLMFKTIKRGNKLDLSKPNLTEQDIVEEGLRYDLTVPLVRFFANNKNDLPYPFKATQIDESFRAERPQKGRYRQFTQCDIDILGDETELAEIEIITTVMQAYKNVGLKNLVVAINSRKILRDIILNSGFAPEDETSVCIVIDKIDKIGLDGCKKELLKQGYESQAVEKLYEVLLNTRGKGIEALVSLGFAVEECEKMQEILNHVKPNLATDYDIVFDVGIVRGQGYYTGAVFEVFQKDGEYKGALGGGGRYDNMIEQIINEKVPAIGFGLGLDVVLLVMKEQGVEVPKNKQKIAVIYGKDDAKTSIFELKNKLSKTYDVALLPEIRNFKELERKLKLNNFDGLVTLKNSTDIKWF